MKTKLTFLALLPLLYFSPISEGHTRGFKPNLTDKIISDREVCDTLEDLWREKIKNSKGSKDFSLIKAFHRKNIEGGCLKVDFRRSSMEDLIQTGDVAIDPIEYDWDKVSKGKGYSDRKTNLLRQIVLNIQSRDLIAHSITEISPRDGELDRFQTYDQILRNYGPEFVRLLPSSWDKLFSIGFFQQTRHVFAPNEDGSPSGIPLVNNAVFCESGNNCSLKEDFTQGLSTEDQFKGAHMLATFNLIWLIKRLNSSQLGKFEKGWRENFEGIVEFIGAASYKPRHAIDGAMKWIDSGLIEDFHRYPVNGETRNYAKLTGEHARKLWKGKREGERMEIVEYSPTH